MRRHLRQRREMLEERWYCTATANTHSMSFVFSWSSFERMSDRTFFISANFCLNSSTCARVCQETRRHRQKYTLLYIYTYTHMMRQKGEKREASNVNAQREHFLSDFRERLEVISSIFLASLASTLSIHLH